jgi:DtxR family Mn-dependent transcriptional regulator
MSYDLTTTEENYLKALVHLSVEKGIKDAGTNELAAFLNVKPATATDMLKKLREKKYVDYEKYGRITLTSTGKKIAIEVIRKHRLWETFLCDKLNFTWDEVHEVAEQLEHIQSKKLIDQLDKFLGFPTVDPHGEAIPNAKGEMKIIKKQPLTEASINQLYTIIGVKEDTPEFLQYADKIGCKIGTKLKVISHLSFDDSIEILIQKESKIISRKFAESVFVEKK